MISTEEVSVRQQSIHRRFAAALFATMLLAVMVSGTALAGSGHVVRVITDDSGQRLEVDGEDFLVFGMNWGYMPIGENYTYDFWGKPDDFIKSALDTEMAMLQDMGVNAIRQYVGIPPRWVSYIHENYGIYTVINPLVARYGMTIDGAWIPSVDYSHPKLRQLQHEEIRDMVERYRDTPGLLMYLLGNENNYGLHWSSFEIEALPEEVRGSARARHLYSLMGELTELIQELDPDLPVSMANGDLLYIDIIAEEMPTLDIFGTNVYRGISVLGMYQEVADKMGIPLMFTEFGSDAWNAKDMREDQYMQARYLIGQWQEIYEQSSGKGRVGNAIGGLTFQWADGWWKYLQSSRLDIHDTNASWPNGGYSEDYVEGENNMNEEWWGICAKGPTSQSGFYTLYPRAAYFALRKAYQLDPYAPDTDLEKIRAHFATVRPGPAVQEAQGARGALIAEDQSRVRVSNLRMEFETITTGGKHTSTPEIMGVEDATPAFRGFDKMQSFYVDVEAKPMENVIGRLSVNMVGDVPTNPIDEIFYENRGPAIEAYQASLSWDDRYFMLDAFYRTGHLHWGFEGDFFGLYRDAYYGPNVDIYGGMAPIGFEMAFKKKLNGLKLAFGPQLWWGANPALFLKYQRDIGPFATTTVYHQDLAAQSALSSSIAIPIPETKKLSFQVVTSRGPWTAEAGVLWAGSEKVGDGFGIAEESGGVTNVLGDEILDSDTFGFKGKLLFQNGPWNAYVQGANMGLVAEGGPPNTITYTGWSLRDTGSGNQNNFLAGVAYTLGNWQISPNFLWQTPKVGPLPPSPTGAWAPRNVQSDPFAVRWNRETVGAELMLTYDMTPGSWMWQWDNDQREDALLAASLGLVYRDLKTTTDASLFIAADGVTVYAFGAAPPPAELWDVKLRLISKMSPRTRLILNAYAGKGAPSGWTAFAEDPQLNRFIERFGASARFDHDALSANASVKVNDWGPYDYHRDFNLTYPLQVNADLSYSLGSPAWFDGKSTQIGVRGAWRSLDEFSPRYETPFGAGGEHGNEWEFRTYVRLSI